LDLILSKNTRGAQKFAQLYSTHHVDLYDDELQSLLTCTNSKQLDDEIIFLPGNRLLKKLKQHRFTLKLSQLANKMLVNYLNSTLLSFDMYGADDKQLLRAMVNDKLTIDVQSYDVLPSSSSSSSSGSSNSNTIPTFELFDYIPGMYRKSRPPVDSYMPVYNNIINKGLATGTGSGSGKECINANQIKCPDTRNDRFYKDLVTKLIIPQQVLGLNAANSTSGGTSGVNSNASNASSTSNKRTHADAVVTDLIQSSLHPSVLFSTVSNTDGKFNSNLVCCSYNDIGTRIACGFSDSLIRIWDVNTPNRNANTFANHLSKPVTQKPRSIHDVVPKSRDSSGKYTYRSVSIGYNPADKDVEVAGSNCGV